MATSSDSNNLIQSDGTFSELLIIQAFHFLTVKSLSQAKAEGLLDEDTLASAEADVMICGPALCLFFAALRSRTTPPSVPIPTSATGTTEPVSLSRDTCPPVFQPFFRLWAQAVPAIQALPSEAQHDLARIICDKPPLITATPADESASSSNSAPVHLMRIAGDLRAVAIEITQRRTFQERYQLDLQSALDAGQPPPSPGMPPSEKRRVAAFSPPPSYDETLSQGSHSQQSSVNSSPQRLPTTPSRLNAPLPNTPHAPGNSEGMQSLHGAIAQAPPQSAGLLTVDRPSTSSAGASSSRHRSRPSSPTFLPPDAPAIHLIRETLYAALGEVIATTPSIIPILKSDPSRAYFSTVALAILTVSTDCLTAEGGVITPLGHELTLAECPPAYRPLMHELGGIGTQAKRIREEDDERAMYLARSGSTEPFEPRMERLRSMLEKGVANEEERFDAAIVAANQASGPPPLAAPPAAAAPVPVSQAPPVPASIPLQQIQSRGRNTSPPPPMPIPTVPGSIAHAILSTTSPKSPSPTRPTRSPPTSSSFDRPPFTTPAEDAQLLNPTTSNNQGSLNSSATSSPRSSGEQARGLGLRNLLHKPKPGSNDPPTPPAVALKPAPPTARYAQPSTPPPSMPVPHPPANPAGMAGVGTAMGGPPMSYAPGVGSPPRAAMMAHQSSLSATGNPYEMALGSGARISGLDSGLSPPPNPTPVPPAVQNPPAEPVPTETSNPRRSIEGSTVQFANRINALTLNMTRLRMFQERQDMVFKILASVHD